MTQIDMDVSGMGHNKSDLEVGGLDMFYGNLIMFTWTSGVVI